MIFSRFPRIFLLSHNNNYKYNYINLVNHLHRKSIYKTDEAKKVRFFILHKYVEYLKNYDKVLERSFSGAMRVYRIFTVGIKEFMTDLRNFVRVVRFLHNKKKYNDLTRNELELYHQMPKDMRKVSPVLLISALPLANYVIFPIAYLFPQYFLSSHFWTLQQKSEFKISILTERLKHYKPTFRLLQEQLDNLKDNKLYEQWAVILGMLGSGQQPTPQQIIQCKDLFMCEPYHIFYLRHSHVKHLLKIHELHMGWFRRTRLTERAVILKEMDNAIIREGGVENLSIDALKNCCYIRGLNPTNMRNEDMINWLNNWILISQATTKEHLSLLLHSPILLTYNEPSNWILIYPHRKPNHS